MPSMDPSDADIVETQRALISGKVSEYKERKFFSEKKTFENEKMEQ